MSITPESPFSQIMNDPEAKKEYEAFLKAVQDDAMLDWLGADLVDRALEALGKPVLATEEVGD